MMASDQTGSQHDPRIDMAEDRTLLASERTFAGWLRTSLAAIGIGIGFHVLFQKIEPAWVPRAIATIFLAIAIAVVLAAARRARAVSRRLHAHEVVSARAMNLTLIAAAVACAAAVLILANWFVEFG